MAAKTKHCFWSTFLNYIIFPCFFTVIFSTCPVIGNNGQDTKCKINRQKLRKLLGLFFFPVFLTSSPLCKSSVFASSLCGDCIQNCMDRPPNRPVIIHWFHWSMLPAAFNRGKLEPWDWSWFCEVNVFCSLHTSWIS